MTLSHQRSLSTSSFINQTNLVDLVDTSERAARELL